MAIRIDVSVRGEEAILRLDSLPRRLREQLTQKMRAALGTARTDMLDEVPGKYLAKELVTVEVQSVGDLLIATLEGKQKPGFIRPAYGPKTAGAMAFFAKSGDWVVTKRIYQHPYPDPKWSIEKYFRENKPWLIEQIEDAVFDVVYS